LGSPPEEGTEFDLLYSKNRGINRRRGANEGVYPIKSLDKRKIFKRKKSFKKL